MALLAAALTSFPMAIPLLVFTVSGSPVLGLTFAATMFVPALLGILLLQLPLKTLLLRREVRASRIMLALFAANLALVFALALLLRIEFDLGIAALLTIFTLYATAVWTTLDDRALHGPAGYSRDRYDA